MLFIRAAFDVFKKIVRAGGLMGPGGALKLGGGGGGAGGASNASGEGGRLAVDPLYVDLMQGLHPCSCS